MSAPNLDAMDSGDLMSFWHKHQQGRQWKQLFPDRMESISCVKCTVSLLANYASNKATAMSCRERGDIYHATQYEAIAEKIYKELPEFAKW